MNLMPIGLASSLLAVLPASAGPDSDTHLLGEMRRMFTAQDIKPNVDLAEVNRNPHLYALGPVAGLKGEVTVFDGQVFVSQAGKARPNVSIDPKVKSVFLVYATVPAWRSVDVPSAVVTENDLAGFIETQLPRNTRSAFLVEGTALSVRYHIQNYKGRARDLTHEAHDRSKVFYEFTNAPAQLVGFFTNREGDGGSFVHLGQKTHIHVISMDRKQMGHLESIQLAPGAKLFLPEKAGRL